MVNFEVKQILQRKDSAKKERQKICNSQKQLYSYNLKNAGYVFINYIPTKYFILSLLVERLYKFCSCFIIFRVSSKTLISPILANKVKNSFILTLLMQNFCYTQF